MPEPAQRWMPHIAELTERYELPPELVDRLASLVAAVAEDPHAPTTIRDPFEIVDQHLADSLVALELEAFSPPACVVDLGAGAGFPGLPLALARPRSAFVLLDSTGRKCEFIQRAAHASGAGNVEVVHARAEAWPEGSGRFDIATARALAPLDVVIEYAAPLLRVGGLLVAWRGRRQPDEEQAAERAAAVIGLEVVDVRAVRPFADAQTRHLHLISKVLETPLGFPRRPGMAAKKPLGATSRRPG